MPVYKHVTMQDIADACQLSRNTVSKVFNNRGSVPESTRQYVLSVAAKLGYQSSSVPPLLPAQAPKHSIALFTHSDPQRHNFGLNFITAFTDRICRSGYSLKIFQITDVHYRTLTLPEHFDAEASAGILGIELFDRDYTKLLSSLGLPTLFIDSYTKAPSDLMRCDFIYMENYASSLALTNRMISGGAKRLGFVGDIEHCSSFRERWNGFRSSILNAGLTVDPTLSILESDSMPYTDPSWLAEKLSAMPGLPEALFCANDSLALHIMKALSLLGKRIPEDIQVTGFDGSPESEFVTPTLTTALIPSAEIGTLAADQLMNRIKDPASPFVTFYVKTTPLWRGSVRS